MTQTPTDPDDYFAAVHAAELRARMIKITNHEYAPRLAPAASAVREALHPRRATSWKQVAMAGHQVADVQTAAINKLLRDLVAVGFIRKTGDYSRVFDRRLKAWKITDTRMLTLDDWPQN